MAELSFRLILQTSDATGQLQGVKHAADTLKAELAKPTELKLSAAESLATIRDVKIAFDGVLQIVRGVTTAMNSFLDAELSQRRAMILANLAFGEAAQSMADFAQAMQQVTNFEDDQLLALMSKLATTFKLNKDEIQQLTPLLLDFTEAFSATGMTVDSAFDLMGRALNGHTEMLGRYGIELDKTRLAQEGVSYLVETLGEDYGGTASALADLRTQNKNAWGDIQETVGGMINTLISPLLQGLRWLMDAYNSLSPVMKGFVTGLAVAIPLIVSVTAALSAATVAIHALKTAINPVAGLIGIIVGALAALGFAYAAAAAPAQDFTQKHKSMTDNIKDCSTAVASEAEQFNILAGQLLDIRAKTEQTRESKAQMQTIIEQLNSKYGQYLGNINLETAAYNDLTRALQGASEALIQKKIVESYGEQYSAAIKKVADLTIELRKKYGPVLSEAIIAAPPTGTAPGGAVDLLISQLQTARGELQTFEKAYRDALKNLPKLTLQPTPSSGGPAPLDSGLSDYDQLSAELVSYFQSENDKLLALFKERKALIISSTKADSDTQKEQLTLLGNWLTAEQAKLQTQRDADSAALVAQQQAKFQKEIDNLSNLHSMGVSSYSQLKQTMSDYYAWAKQNLPEQEQQLILGQMRQANLRYGQYLKAKIDQMRAHARELQRVRAEFADRDLDLAGNEYQRQLNRLDQYYAENQAKMRAAGITQEQIEAQHQAAILAIKIAAAAQMVSGVSGVLANLASAQNKESEKGFKNWKALSLAQAMMDALSGANAAYKSMAGIPVVGPALGFDAAAAALVAGYANIRKIEKTEFEKKELGGPITGPAHTHGGVLIEAEGGEYVASKSRVNALGKSFFDFLNFAPLAAVRSAFAGLSYPTIPMPAFAGAFASGGSISASSGTMDALLGVLTDLKLEIKALKNSKPIIDIHVDPLANNPVKVSEIADTGARLRSAF